MKLSYILYLIAALLFGGATPAANLRAEPQQDLLEYLQNRSIGALQASRGSQVTGRHCTVQNAVVRRDW